MDIRPSRAKADPNAGHNMGVLPIRAELDRQGNK
jgi:hypothetical protein